jgi:hypothetical protein
MRIKIFSILTLAIVLSAVLPGCFRDVVLEKYSFYRPVYRTRAEVRADIKSALPQPVRNPGKLFVKGNYIFLNDVEKGVHVIDYSNPAQPTNIAFIAIPGNVDLAVNGNHLYADQYTDLVTLDISNPLNVVAVNFDDKVFPQRHFPPDTNLVVVDWIKIDTTIRRTDRVRMETVLFSGGPLTSAGSGGGGGGSAAGVAGSMARFALMNDRLYTVSTFELKVFNTVNAANPSFVKQVFPGTGDIETIYPFKDKLFLGSRSGMHIFNVASPDNPVKTGMFSHARACDPVVVDDNYAYVTLRSGTPCMSQNNQMDIVNITNINAPTLLKTYQFANPHGLSKDGDHIFLCDGTAGLKVLNAQNVNNITTLKTFTGMETFDVIAINNIAITVAKEGLFLIDYSNLSDIKIKGQILTAR